MDQVRVHHRRQAMGDDHGGAPAHEFAEGRLHLAFGFRVQGRGRLVEQQDGGVLERRPGDGQALALAAGKLDALFADHGVVALGKGADERVGGGVTGGGDDLGVAGPGPAIGDVGPDRVVEKGDLLADQGDVGIERGQRDVAHVGAVDENPARGHVVEAGNQVEDGRLAGPRRSDQGHRLSRRHLHGDPVQRRSSGLVGEPHVFQADAPGGDRKWARRRLFADARFHVQQVEHPLRAGQPFLEVGVEHGQLLHRLVGEQERREKGEKGAGIGLLPDHPVSPVDDDDGDGGAAQRLHDGAGQRPYARRPEGEAEDALDDSAHAAFLVFLHAVGLDHADALEGLFQQGGQLAHFLLGVGGDRAHPPAEADDGKHRQGKGE